MFLPLKMGLSPLFLKTTSTIIVPETVITGGSWDYFETEGSYWFEMRKDLCEKKLFPYNIWTNSFKAIHGTMIEPLVNNLTIISDLEDINKIYFQKNENTIGSLKFFKDHLTLIETS